VWAAPLARAEENTGAMRDATDAERAALLALFDGMRAALEEGEGGKVSAMFDTHRTMVALKDQGALAGADLGMILGMRVGLQAVVRVGPSYFHEELTWTKHKLGSARIGADGKEAEVCLRHINEDNYSYWMRWWLVKGKESWLAYDFEAVSSAQRMTMNISETAARTSSRESQLERAQNSIDAAFDAVEYGDPDEARELLAQSDRVQLHPNLQARKWLYEAYASIDDEDGEAALALLAKVRKSQADFLILSHYEARAYALAGQHDLAIAAARRSLTAIGPDAEMHAVMGEAHFATDRKDEAAQAFRDGLAADPGSVECLQGLAKALPKGKKDELADHFARFPDAEVWFEDIIYELWDEEDVAAMDALIAAYRKLMPDDPDADYYDAQARLIEQKPRQAAEILLRAIKKMQQMDDDEELEYFVTSYLDAMIEADAAIEGYRGAPDPAQAFTYLADSLQYGESTKLLRELIAAHRAARPDDLWSFYYLGIAEAKDKKFAAAEKAFREGMRFTLNTEILDQFRDARVQAAFDNKQGLAAYERIPPRRATFVQLAELYLDADDAQGFAALIAAHRKSDPRDANLAVWEAESHWRNKRYADVIKTLRSNRDAIIDQSEDAVWEYEDHMIRALVRTQRFDEAMVLAKASTARDEDPWYEVMVNAARGDVVSTMRLIQQSIDEQGYEAEYYYDDDDMGPALRSDKFAKLREKYPDPYPDEEDESEPTPDEAADRFM
jgi:hypothetical protein